MSDAKQDHVAEQEHAEEAATAEVDLTDDVPVDEQDALRAEVAELKDRLLRTLAESENVRKRAERDRREAEKFGGSRIVRDLLPVYDNLRRALNSSTDAVGEADKALTEGVELTLRELLKVMDKHGVTLIAPEVGETFDPNTHEAMFEAPVPGTKAGDILQVMTEGFLLHDRLIRPAQVGVSSNPG
ncbi:nucleotide exchange factor GrpE [Roseicyclus marinus]|uniref:nucleotide exchange factor GrpE n=1 Tax=Roseicyclus marinus TaxID=2161673 RepID=UPI00240FFFF5|nr:nucleotide exchange factor GrpE [Roseicyclus marinus]MDG3041461.1 nucleotide exchange factor GrpE [Roseicyclus marinus]